MGVLGVFVLLVVGYGLVVAHTGNLYLPQRVEDKEPLSPHHRDDDVEADVKKAPSSYRTENSCSGETENASVADDEPPSYDKVVQAASSSKQEAATNTNDCDVGGQTVDGGNVMVEVYEQKVDTRDEMA